MITDARVLQPEFIPSEVKHRDAEVNTLSSVLRPLTDGVRADPAFLYGPSGTGKTCIAQFTVERLRQEVVDVNYQYVNCWEDYSRFKTLYTILDGINNTIDIHRQSTPKDVLLDRLKDYTGPPYVVILDEVDQLQDKSLLYDLYRVKDLTMLLIANKETEVFAEIDDRLTSRLTTATRIHFDHYSRSELTTILNDRVQWGLVPNIIDQERLNLIAAKAAGDARIAIGILRNAARHAHGNSLDEIPTDVIRDVVPETKSEIQQQTIDRLTDHQQTLYDIITDHGTIEPQALYDEYQERVTDPKTKRTVRNHLSKLEHYNLIGSEGNTKGRIYRALT
ncbi:Cdc6/Cdc18 family protein [Halorubrum rubrum]|uniref:Cdc6/Cdc18 family protein n=1 Tax=Halorubrum rubrum TaxID=1126240 RepID=A0ABD5R5A0_9EURY|nr:Cdc6/Cdc18 family protein [Halorubrum rubrum]